MASDAPTDGDDGRAHTNHELRAMDDETAKRELTVVEYERREKLIDLHDQAEEQAAEWENQAQQVAEITVSADPDQLGTEVDVFGNELLVHVDPEDPQLTTAAEDLDALRERHDDSDVEAIPDDDAERMASLLQDMIDAALVRWDGTEWDSLDGDQRRGVLAEARTEWGLDGLLLAWFDILAAVNEDREDKMDVIESFRSPERRGRR